MRNLVIRKHFECNFTPDQWELLTNSFDRTVMDKVANELNKCLQYVANDPNMRRSLAEEFMFEEMKKLSKYGAYDSEPRWFLSTVLDEIYA